MGVEACTVRVIDELLPLQRHGEAGAEGARRRELRQAAAEEERLGGEGAGGRAVRSKSPCCFCGRLLASSRGSGGLSFYRHGLRD